MVKYRQFSGKYGMQTIVNMILYKFVKRQREHVYTGSSSVWLNRINSSEYLFDQLFRQVFQNSTESFIQNNNNPFSARLMGEGSIDAGGPFRDVCDNLCVEINDQYLELTTTFEEEETFKPKLLTSILDLQKLLLIGKFIGWSIHNGIGDHLSLVLDVIFWKKLLGVPLLVEDLKFVDVYRYQMLQ
jgi:hypothetical protein